MALAEQLLTLKEVAELENQDYYTITKRVQRGKISAVKIDASTRQGFEYRVAVKDLSEKAQARYFARLRNEAVLPPVEEKVTEKYEQGLNELTGEQRDEMAFWKKVLEDWRKYIAQFPKQKTEKTKEFIQVFNTMHADRAIQERTLRHKWKLYKEFGEIALADHRKNRKDRGTTKIDELLWSVFLQWWLDEAQPTVTHIHSLVKTWVELDMPQLQPVPSVDSFYRAIKLIPESVLAYFRRGEKAFTDECLLYIQRLYDLLDSNDIWTSDYHTADFFVRDDVTNKVYRPHIVVWMDIRSRKMLSISLCETSNSDGVITSFRKAVGIFGIPKRVYLDNGKEFLVRDFGGRGKRKTSAKTAYGTTMLERLGIEMTNAKVRNGKAKVIERSFKEFANEFSRLVTTYSGNTPTSRPERLSGVMKNVDNIPLKSEMEQKIWTYFEGWYNEYESEAEGLNGQSPNQCYAANLINKRVATKEELDQILLRTARLQTIDRNGVFLKIGERKIWFYDTELVHNHMGKKAFVCYDNDDLSSVLVRDAEERLIGTAHMLEVGGYDSEKDKPTMEKLKSYEKKQRKLVKDFMDKQVDKVDVPEALEVLIKKAQMNIEQSTIQYEAKVVEPLAFKEKILAVNKVAAGSEDDLVEINFDKMITNGEKRRGKR
ncbi:transposase [Schinkia azotoformans]|uniref:transposase n=1 Tax=Schinkia azotoformans TaxID=1454 RepID=UPI002E20780C|nr:transposase [Schinkia azotoformans]